MSQQWNEPEETNAIRAGEYAAARRSIRYPRVEAQIQSADAQKIMACATPEVRALNADSSHRQRGISDRYRHRRDLWRVRGRLYARTEPRC
jgi:hypothetical protein